VQNNSRRRNRRLLRVAASSNITVNYEDREVRLTVTPQEFNQLKVGDVYSREMKLGGLGYYYTWGLAFWK